MRDLLTLTHDAATSGVALEKLGQKRGYRVKSCLDYDQACEWLSMRRYDFLCIDSKISFSCIERLSTLLWKRNPQAILVVVLFESGDSIDTQRVRLIGGRVASELSELDKIMREQSSALPVEQDNFKILVIEDLDSPRDIICIFIESLGFSNVEGVESGEKALQILEERGDEFSCVVTDVKMPRITGKEVIEVVRKNQNLQHLPIIVLTAYGTVDTLVDCLKAGASGFLVKPPKKNDMLREISRAIRIAAGQESPRLASFDEADYVRGMLEGQKVI